MKKRGMCVLLAVLLLVGFWPPALAYEDETPLWQEWGYASKEDFCQRVMKDYYDEPLSEDEYERMEVFYEENLELLREQLEDEWRYEGFESKEAYLAAMGYADEDSYLREYATYLTQSDMVGYRERQAYQEEMRQFRKQLGMTWDGVNVQVNGGYLRFNAAYPEYSQGNLMVPLGPLASALGTVANTTGEGGVSLRYGARAVAFVMGQSTITAVASDGSRWPSEAPVAPYQKNGDIYVPVRAFGQALGLLVIYDDQYDCVVLVDKQRAIDQIDSRFTILNDLPDLSQAIDPEKTYRTELSGTVKITEFNSIDGDEVYPVSGKLTVVHQGVNMHCDLVLDLSSLIELVKKSVEEWFESDWADDEDRAQWEKIESALGNLRTMDYEIIVNQDEDVVYLKSATLVQLLQSQGVELPQGPLDGAHTWFKLSSLDLDELELPESIGLGEARLTVGEELFGRVFEAVELAAHYSELFGNNDEYQVYFYNSCLLYGELGDLAGALETLVGDQHFTRQGQANTVEFDLAKLDAQQAAAIRDAFDLRELRGKLAIDQAAKRIAGNLYIRGDEEYSYRDTLMQAAFDLSPGKGDIMVELHEKNVMKLEVRLTGNSSETTESVPTAPPAGDLVIGEEVLQSLQAA